MTVGKFLQAHGDQLALHGLKVSLMLGADADEVTSKGAETIYLCWDEKFDHLLPDDQMHLAKAVLFNQARNLGRARRRREEHEHVGEREDVRDVVAEYLGEWVNPLQIVLFREQRLEIYREISRLENDGYREAVAIAALEFDRAEAANFLGITEGAYRNRLMRGRSILRERLSIRQEGE